MKTYKQLKEGIFSNIIKHFSGVRKLPNVTRRVKMVGDGPMEVPAHKVPHGPMRYPYDAEFDHAFTFADSKGKYVHGLGVNAKTGHIHVQIGNKDASGLTDHVIEGPTVAKSIMKNKNQNLLDIKSGSRKTSPKTDRSRENQRGLLDDQQESINYSTVNEGVEAHKIITALSHVEKQYLMSAINKWGTGQHPMANEKTLEYFQPGYLKQILVKSLKNAKKEHAPVFQSLLDKFSK